MTGPVQTEIVRAADGRELCVEVAPGDRERCVVVCNGTPNSRHLFSPWVEDAASRGTQLIGYDRPGYGGSTPDPDHSVADGAGDVRAIADALGIERFAVWGFSGGGPFSLACAALLPERVVAAAVLGSLAPWGAPGLDYFEGMGEQNVEGIKEYLEDPEADRERGAEMRRQYLKATAEGMKEQWATLLSPVDAQAADDEFYAWLLHCIQDGLAPSEQGWWDDGVAHMAPWGFEPQSIGVPVKVWHGRHDRFVPFGHGRWLAENVPGAEAELSEVDGHLTLVINRVGEIHQWLLEHF